MFTLCSFLNKYWDLKNILFCNRWYVIVVYQILWTFYIISSLSISTFCIHLKVHNKRQCACELWRKMRIDLEPFATGKRNQSHCSVSLYWNPELWSLLRGANHKGDSSRFCKCQKSNVVSNETVADVLLIFAANCVSQTY